MSPTAKHVDAEMRNLKFLENIFLSELFLNNPCFSLLEVTRAF